MQLTGIGRPDCDVESIYKLLGKKPFSATNLKELKDAAEKLGFSATGYKLTVHELQTISGYAILPVGSAPGTPRDPLHFILVAQVTKDHVSIVDAQTLRRQTMTVSELGKSWNGYALVISPNKVSKGLLIQ